MFKERQRFPEFIEKTNDEETAASFQDENGNLLIKDVYRLNIHKRLGRKLQRFAETDKTEEELYNGDIEIGPDFYRLNNDDSSIKVVGGDGRPCEILSNFEDAHFLPSLMKNMRDKLVNQPTLIQKCVIPIILHKPDYDLMARAQTGSGKTNAFLLPVIDILAREKLNKRIGGIGPFAVIKNKGRKCTHTFVLGFLLKRQLGENAQTFIRGLPLKVTKTYGETCINDARREIAQGSDIVVATPGRLKQFVNENIMKLNKLMFFILDEADKLLQDQFKPEMEFVRDRIVETCSSCRTLMFSATLDTTMQRLATRLLRPNYFSAAVCLDQLMSNELAIVETIVENFVEASEHEKMDQLCELLESQVNDYMTDENGLDWNRLEKTLIFCNTRRRSNWVALQLSLRGFKAFSTNGDRLQYQRQEAMDSFVKGTSDILVATNVVARGMNIVGVKHVINYELPKDIADYIHRIGRTGRAGNHGKATALIDRNKVVDRQICALLIPRLISKRLIYQPIPEFLHEIAGLSLDD